MFVVTLTFGPNRAEAGRLMAGHKAWIEQGFADGVFLMTGSLEGGAGGAVLAHGMSREELDARRRDDPFVAEAVVEASVTALAPSRVDPRLGFLAGS